MSPSIIATNNVIKDLFHNQFFDYCLRFVAVKKEYSSSSLPTFSKQHQQNNNNNRLRSRNNSNQSFLSTIDELYECSNNNVENDDDEGEDNGTININNSICNIIMIYLIMILIIGGTAIIATERGIESMMPAVRYYSSSY
jgi:hypothetical protein